jgi:hypothetical protein
MCRIWFFLISSPEYLVNTDHKILITQIFWSPGPSSLLDCKKLKQYHCRPGVEPEGSRKLRFPDFLTTAQDGGKVVSLTHRPHLPPGNNPGTHFC